MQTETGIRAERVKSALQQIPLAALVTVVNGILIAAVLESSARNDLRIYAWVTLTVMVAAGRLGLWLTYRRTPPTAMRLRSWSIASAGGALVAGLVWGGGSVWLLPASEPYQLFWIFLIGGMCAGAASLHYAHLPTALAFIVPAGLPLAIRFALMGSGRHAAAAAMMSIFLAALVVTSCRSSRYFGETTRLRFDLAERTRDLAAINDQLRTEMAEHQATEATLRHAQKMEAVGQLTGGIAHDFNNLLTVILGSLSLLRKHLPANDERADELLANAVQGAERGAGLIQRLLAFGRRQVLRPEVIDLPTLVRGMLPLMYSSVGPKAQITIRLPNNLPPVEVDANQLELALLNLVVNSRDAMPDGGEITLTAQQKVVDRPEAGGLLPGIYVVLSVTDTGEGMDEDTLSRAMEPFFTTKEVDKGTGLGLAMVHGLAAQSGGQLRLHSRQGVGTVAELWLPRPTTVAASEFARTGGSADGIQPAGTTR